MSINFGISTNLSISTDLLVSGVVKAGTTPVILTDTVGKIRNSALKVVPTIDALKALSLDGFAAGDTVRITDLDRNWYYDPNDTRPGNDVTILTPDVGSGRWELVKTINDYDANSVVQGRGYLSNFHSLLMAGSPVKMIFSGDSTTEGTNIVNSANILSTLVGNMMQVAFPYVTSINAGHSSMSTTQWLATYLAADLAQNPNLYVLRWGINDGSLNPDTFLTNLETGLLTIRQSFSPSQMTVVLMSPNATNDGPLGRDAEWYQRVVPALPDLARKYKCVYIDTYSLYIDAAAYAGAMDSPYASLANAGTFSIGATYQITTVGSTNWVAIGASANLVGVAFDATGVGSGTGVAAVSINAGSFVTGTDYVISRVGTTDFTLIGAEYNAIGVTFTATGAGTGTGRAVNGIHIHPLDIMNDWIGGEIFNVIAPAGVRYRYAYNNVTATHSGTQLPSVTDAPSTYPYGVSLKRSIPANGWVLDGGVFTQRSPDEVVIQIANDYIINSAFKVRSAATPSTWNSWQYFVNASGASLAASAIPSSYQTGLNVYNVLASNSWPSDGLLITNSGTSGLVSQTLITTTGIQTRLSTSSSAWSAWSGWNSATPLPVANGGTGQSSYTNGQILIGNTTGNTLTKSTLTGTSNQVVVTNGTGSITLSTPQDIGTGSTPQFSSMGVGGAAPGSNGLKVFGTTGSTSTTTGALIVNGGVGVAESVFLGGSLVLTAANAAMEIGSVSTPNTPFIDFHSSGNNIDFDARIIVSGGTGSNAQGLLTFTVATAAFAGAANVAGVMTAQSATASTSTSTGGLVVTGGVGVGGSINAGGTVAANLWQTTTTTTTFAATTNIDMTGTSGMTTLSLTGDVTFTTSNRAAGRGKVVRIICDATPRNLTFPAGWVFLGSATPTAIAASKTAILSITFWGANDTDAVVAWAVQP